MVSEDVFKEMPVNVGEAGIQLVLLQLCGSVSPVEVYTTLSGLKLRELERGHDGKEKN